MNKHEWDGTGERCIKCGAKDWMGGECSSSSSPACSIAESRAEFEAWITKPPFERNVDRYPNDPTRYGWPGAYQVYEIELAWEAWQAARQ